MRSASDQTFIRQRVQMLDRANKIMF
jgi:hypothetical protein